MVFPERVQDMAGLSGWFSQSDEQLGRRLVRWLCFGIAGLLMLGVVFAQQGGLKFISGFCALLFVFAGLSPRFFAPRFGVFLASSASVIAIAASDPRYNDTASPWIWALTPPFFLLAVVMSFPGLIVAMARAMTGAGR